MNKHGGYYGDQKHVLDFSVNINPLGLPSSVIKRLETLTDDLVNYPEPDSLKARVAIAHAINTEDALNLTYENIIMGNGATELIYLFARSIKPKKVLLLQPTFNEYERAFRQAGSKCIYFQVTEATEFRVDEYSLMRTIIKIQPDVVVVCNPNNPTGSYIPKDMLKRIYTAIDSYHGYLLIDESFYEFERQPTATELVEKKCMIIRSMTKYYAIAGIRLGYGIGSTKLIRLLEEMKEPWSVNGLATAIVPDLLTDWDFQEKTNQWYKEEKQWMQHELESLPNLIVYSSSTNYFFCKVTISSGLQCEKLLEDGIYIRTCEDFVGLDSHYVRLAVKKHEDNKTLISVLKKHLGGNYDY